MSTVGKSPVRLEDPPLIRGEGRYVADLVDADTLYAVFVRSPLAHGELQPPDLEAALASPGVVAAFSAESLDLPLLPSSPGRGAPEALGMGQPPLARERVRYLGEPIAVIVAESQIAAVDGAEQVWVEIDPLPVVTTVAESLSGEVVLFPSVGTNLVHEETIASPGSPPAVSQEMTVEIEVPRVSPVTIEPLAILARPGADGHLEVWCGHQSPSRLPQQLGSLIGVSPEKIRARVPFVGGAFGTKGQFYPEYVVVAAVAHRLQRPVAWIQTRTEQLRGGTHGRGQTLRVTIGGDSDGRIRSVRVEAIGDVGAYPATGSRIPFFTQSVAQGLYDFEYLEVQALAAVTNLAPTGPYRGAGRPEGAIAIERAVEAFAHELGLLPEEVRRRNYISRDSLPFRTHTGAIYDSGDYLAALDLALDVAEVDQWRAIQAERRRGGSDPIGIGIGTFVERAGGSVGLGEYGKVEIALDGSVVVRTGSTAAGQAHRTVWSQIAAGVFELPIQEITFYAGDTGEVASGVGSFGSRSVQIGGSAILRTSMAVKAEATKLAAQVLEAAEEDLELVSGRFRVVGSPGAEVSLKELAARAQELGVVLAAEEMFVPDAITYPYGAYVAVVEVEIETGEVRLLRLVAVDDCGNVINPMVVEGQLHGSVMQGIGSAMLEAIRYDQDGQLLTGNLMSYLIPTATQPMPLLTHRLVHPAPSNPLGAKGAGEAGCIGVPPAILNAVLDALRPHGVTTLDFPLTAHQVWEAINQARRPVEEHS